MTFNVNLSGKITIVQEPGGKSSPVTLDDLRIFGDYLMSQLSDAIANASASADAAISRVQGDVTALQAQITDLQTQVSSGGATPADIQALADLKTKLDALDPTSATTLPAAP